MKKYIALLLAMLMVLSLCACGDKPADEPAQEARHIGFVVYGAANQSIAPEMQAITDYIEAQGDTYTLLDAAYDFGKMPDLVEQLIVQEVDGIIVLNLFPDACREAFEKAKEAGIPCVVTDCGFNDEDKTLLVGQSVSDNTTAGEMVVEAYVRDHGDSGNVILLYATDTMPALDRTNAMKATLAKYPNINILAEEVVDVDIQKSTDAIENLIQVHGGDNIDAIFGFAGNPAIGAVAACQANGYTDIAVYGIDASVDELNLIKSGMQAGTVAQDFIMLGQSAVTKLYQAMNGEEITEYFTYAPVTYVDASNVDEYLEAYGN